jgi:hypothetical protein
MATLYWTNEDTGEIDAIKFDAVTSEDPTDAVTITDHPVEEGANVVDHARDEPARITIEAYVTNTPHQGNLNEDDDHVTTSIPLTARLMGDPGSQSIKLDVAKPPVEISESGLIQAGVSALGGAIFGAPNETATVQSPPDPRSRNLTATALQSPSRRNRAREAYDKLLAAMQARALVTVVADMREYFDMLIERVGKPRASGDGTAVKFQVDLRRLRIAESKTVQSPQPTEARGATVKSFGSQSVKEDPNAVDKESILHNQLGL